MNDHAPEHRRSPREVLLAAHRSREPDLDRLRRRFVVELGCRPARPVAAVGSWLATAGRELFLVYRHGWLGLAVVWLVIGGWHLLQDQRPPAPRLVGGPTLPVTEQEQELLSAHQYPDWIWWTGPFSSAARRQSVTAPRVPGPRSEDSGAWLRPDRGGGTSPGEMI